ncbi:hypothetical protein [Undibacterium sp. TJN19]|uniref:hypothetical protein n=1 Tax=Undibacterium sp. TJN19 TaxID=3413055 RepID=UPI003BF0F5E6
MSHKILGKTVFAFCAICLPLTAALITPVVNATSVMDMRFESMLVKAADLKRELNLNANQQMLWQQTENKLQSIQHQRELRRERLQAELDLRLDKNGMELRDVNPHIEQEEQTSAAENKQIRELVFTMNDALDDKQRQIMQTFWVTSLRAGPDSGKTKRPDGDDAPKQKGGMGRQRSGGMSGGNKF